MSLAQGRPVLAIPGPSIMPDRVLQAMHRPAPNIYEGALVDMVATMVPDLKAVARTTGEVAMYIGNGHAAWEAALANTVSRGERVLVPSTGNFSRGWSEMAKAMGIEVEILDFGQRGTIDPNRLEAALRADPEKRIKAVLVVQVDTSTSVRNDISAVRAAIDATGHPALLMVDCIASLACDVFEMDAWGVDVTLAASQKGLMTPPGLFFLWFNSKAETAHAKVDFVSNYWDWNSRARPDLFYQYFCGTAPTHHLYGLREALTMLLHEEGLDAVWARHATLARAIWAACDAWGADGPLEMNIADPELRSHAVTSLRIGAPNGTNLRNWLIEEAGVTLGIGLGLVPVGDPEWHGFFRIGHMGHINTHGILGVLGAIDAGLKALNIPHGDGALVAASQVCAGK